VFKNIAILPENEVSKQLENYSRPHDNSWDLKTSSDYKFDEQNQSKTNIELIQENQQVQDCQLAEANHFVDCQKSLSEVKNW